MKCIRCGKELQDIKCAGCGFDCSGEHYMTIFPLNEKEQESIESFILGKGQREQEEARYEAQRNEEVGLRAEPGADKSETQREKEAQATGRMEEAEKRRRMVQDTVEILGLANVLEQGLTEESGRRETVVNAESSRTGEIHTRREHGQRRYRRRRHKRMQIVCGISLLLSLVFCIFACFLPGKDSSAGKNGWLTLMIAGAVSVFHICITNQKRKMSRKTREGYYIGLVCCMIPTTIVLMLFLPHITAWLRVTFLLIVLCNCYVVLSIRYRGERIGSFCGFCLMALLCVGGLLFLPNIFSKPINGVTEFILGRSVLCETYYYDGWFGIYSTTGKVKHVYADDRFSDYEGGVYEGNWINGELIGYGQMWRAGNVYEGYFEAGEQNGYGKMTYRNGDVYEGEFVNGEPSGYGEMTYEDGTVYEGNWAAGEQNGSGRLIIASGGVYVGNFVDGERTGFGTYTRTDGAVYEGQFVGGEQTGYGKMTYADGAIYEAYEGEWVNGTWNGSGKLTWADGTVYEGIFLNGEYVPE